MSRPGAGARMTRLLAMVPWIAANDGPTIEETCARFGISRDELLADLAVVWLVGLPPYTPDTLIDVVTEGDRVWIHYPDVFERPQHLTPDQGLALLAAGASVLALPGAEINGPLGRGVRKLAEVLGVDPDRALEVDLGGGRPEVLDALRTAIAQGRRVHLDYYAYGRDARTERDVDPLRLIAHEGAIYLLGWCHLAGGQRSFRVDRIHAATVLDARSETPGEAAEPEVFRPDADDPRVVLDLAAGARWVADRHPVEATEELPDGGLRVTMAITEERWLARLLVNLGPGVRHLEVIGGPAGLAEVGKRAAGQVLARYRGR
jgi:predicted DNA-binding transcriptional regulator YafY